MKYVSILLTTTAIGLAGTAYAGPADVSPAAAKAPTLMTDGQMDHVVAGSDISDLIGSTPADSHLPVGLLDLIDFHTRGANGVPATPA